MARTGLGGVRPPREYEPGRAAARAALAGHLEGRRVRLSEHLTLLLLSRTVLRGAAEEQLRAERVEDDAAAGEVIARMASLLPEDGEAAALLLVESDDPAEQAALLERLDPHLSLSAGDRAIACRVDERTAGDPVVLLRITLDEAARAALATAQLATLSGSAAGEELHGDIPAAALLDAG